MNPDPRPDIAFGSDLIVEVLREAGITKVSLNPGATIRGLHESLVHFEETCGDPLTILCAHEEIAVALAHGYTKATGHIMAVGLHNVVGLAHASMAIFNAYCDRVPMVLLGGTGPMRQANRRPHIDWIHTAYLQGDLVRNFVKWDVQIFGTQSIASFLRRGIDTAALAPHGPVYLCFDVEDQEAPTGEDQLDSGTVVGVHETATLAVETVQSVRQKLEAAQHPVILVDHYNVFSQPEPIAALADLAERFAIPVVDLGGRHNFPTTSAYCRTNDREELLERADVVLALDCRDLYGALRMRAGQPGRGPHQRLVTEECLVVSVTEETVPRGSWVPEGSPPERVDWQLPVPGQVLVDALLDLGDVPEGHHRERRRVWVRERASAASDAWRSQIDDEWDESPISTSRLAYELGAALEGVNAILANSSFVTWPLRLWPLDGERLTHLGRSGGEGLGYGLAASVGAAFAAKESGRVAVDIQGDGDLLFVPSALWTAVAYELPLLVVVHNNQSYHQDAIHQRRMSIDRGRGDGSVSVGIEMTEPPVDFAQIAAGFGCWTANQVTEASDLASVLRDAVQHVVENSKPAVVDVVAAPR